MLIGCLPCTRGGPAACHRGSAIGGTTEGKSRGKKRKGKETVLTHGTSNVVRERSGMCGRALKAEQTGAPAGPRGGQARLRAIARERGKKGEAQGMGRQRAEHEVGYGQGGAKQAKDKLGLRAKNERGEVLFFSKSFFFS